MAIKSATTLRVLKAIPADFSWTRDRYLVGGREARVGEANRAAEAVREIVHLNDSLIHRAWLEHGQLTKRHDLNSLGQPIRRLFHEGGTLVRREYHDRDGGLVSTELFDPDGFITDSTHGRDHWCC